MAKQDYYIKFEEGNIDSLNLAIKKAKSMGYKEWKPPKDVDCSYINFEGKGILVLDENDRDYYTGTLSEFYYKNNGDIEIKLGDKK